VVLSQEVVNDLDNVGPGSGRALRGPLRRRLNTTSTGTSAYLSSTRSSSHGTDNVPVLSLSDFELQAGNDLYFTNWNSPGAVYRVTNHNFASPTSMGTAGTAGQQIGGLAVFPDGRYIISVSGTPLSIALYNAGGGTPIAVYPRTATGQVVDADVFNFGGSLSGLSAVNEAAVYARRGTGGITIMDLATGVETTAGYNNAGSPNYYCGAIVTSTNEYWAMRSSSSTIDVYGLYTRTFKRTISLSDANSGAPGCAYYSTQTNTILISHDGTGTVTERNVNSGSTLVRTFGPYTPGSGTMYGVARRPDTLDVYLTYWNGYIVQYSSTNGATPLNAFSTDIGSGILGIAFLDSSDDAIGGGDSCPSDPLKTSPGQCGCGNLDTDTDSDGTADCNDNCASDPNKIAVGQCGCGFAESLDTDSDGICGIATDNCPTVSNVDQADGDSDGVGNACDNCPNAANADQADDDSDGFGNICDNCSSDPNKTEPGVCGCGYVDSTDTDGDGICGAVTDNCPDVSNADQADADGDGIGDACDNCPNDSNADQADDDSDGIGNVCACPLEDASCDYQPAPPVVTFSDVVIGNDDLAYYRIQMNASRHWSEYVRVLFPESDNDHCNYPSGVVTWAVTTASDDPCTKQYSVDIPMSDFLGKCGFSQTIRNGDSMLFQQTAQIQTNRTCEDGRINELSLSDVELSATRAIERETQYEIEIVAPTNATAKVNGIEVFGAAFKLDLLGDLTITPDIDTNMPTITGFFVTETQHPYELQDPVFALTGDFNYATFELTGTYCTADNSTRLPCQQTWSYSFQPNQTCPDKAQLEGELVQVTWNVNCSDGFIGECAPSFAVQPEATFSLNSPGYCFSSDYIELTPALEVYQFDQLTANSANFGASTLGTLTDNGFSVERVFTIDSQLYAEFTVNVVGSAVTLTATTLKKVSTSTTTGDLVLYDTDDSTLVSTFAVHDTGFGTDESSDFADYRTRFEFTWLNGVTVLLDDIDSSQTAAISATTISIFTNVQSLRKAGIDERHPVLSKLNSDQYSKEQEDTHMILFADGDEPRDSKTTVLARLAPASYPATGSSSSSGFISPTVAAVAVGAVAIIAIAAFAIVRRDKKSSAPESNVAPLGPAAGPPSSSSASSLNIVQPAVTGSMSSIAVPSDAIQLTQFSSAGMPTSTMQQFDGTSEGAMGDLYYLNTGTTATTGAMPFPNLESVAGYYGDFGHTAGLE
jgi:Thrombospondin type 3 repeat